MPRIVLKKDTPTIRKVWFYTKKVLPNRFNYSNRDCLPSKIKVTYTTKYNKDRLNQPDKKLFIQSYSNPQYYPYKKRDTRWTRKGQEVKLTKKEREKRKEKGSSKQRAVKHSYDITLLLEEDPNNEGKFTYDSRILWRVGSMKKWNPKPSQSQVKTVYPDTRKKLLKKYKVNDPKFIKAINKIKSNEYIDVGDYNSRKLGINGDCYFRSLPLQFLFNCVYGPVWEKTLDINSGKNTKIKYPFFDKHMIAVITVLMKRKIIT